jgi:ribonuclease E
VNQASIARKRVDPTQSAAFVDLGLNTDALLPLDKIHPDYLQLPIEERERLITELQLVNKADFFGEDFSDQILTREKDHGTDVTSNRRLTSLNVDHLYGIQDVIKRRQILLVQVESEPKDDIPSLLTTFLSLSGTYLSLLPNRRFNMFTVEITDGHERQRLLEIVRKIDIPEGMGVFVRVQSGSRTEAELVRDFDNLMRRWEGVRDLTLKSTAPTLVYDPRRPDTA